jgi:hypothetical protein
MLQQLEQSCESQISLTDPYSRAMAAPYAGRRRLHRTSGGRRQAQADRRAGCDQPGRGYADANRRTCPRDPRSRSNRRRRADRGDVESEDIEDIEAARRSDAVGPDKPCRPHNEGKLRELMKIGNPSARAAYPLRSQVRD